MADETYKLGDSGENDEQTIGEDRREDIQHVSADEEYIYMEIAKGLNNNTICVKILDSPYKFINFHTTGKNTGKPRILRLNRKSYENLLREEGKKPLKRISCSRLINLLEKSNPGIKERIKESRIPDYEDQFEIEYLANEESEDE